MDFYNKYIKYKQKYLKLKNQHGGVLPYVTLDNGTKDYFPFDNNNFNYYNDDGYTLIDNYEKDKIKENYLLNGNFSLIKLDPKKTIYNEKNIINNNNIYKLADAEIKISDEIKFPFHLCLLSKYKILDKLYLKHINIKIEDILNENFKTLNKKELQKYQDELVLQRLDENFKESYLINNAKIVFKNIFNFNSENRILNITYNYNILLKYSYCNNFLELLKLIYNIQSKIDYKNFDIITKDINNSHDLKYIKILFNDENYNFEDYIVVRIINFFISTIAPISKLKNNFDIIYVFYKEEQLEIEKKQLEKEQSEIEKKQLEIKKEQSEKEQSEKEQSKKKKFEEELLEFEMEKEQLEKELLEFRSEKELLEFRSEKEQLKEELLKLELKIEKKKMIKIKEEKKKQLINKTIENKLLLIKQKKLIIEEEQLKIKNKIKEEEKKLKIDYINAIQTYINISDTTLLFKYISTDDVHFRKEKSNELLKNNILKKIQGKDLNKDLQSLKEHLENDINDIKQLLLFNLYVDNEIDISPKFSHIFYTSFINYRINKSLISYEILLNLLLFL